MLLTIDVGNTNITLGVFDGEKLYTTFRMTTQLARTSDEYGVVIVDMLSKKGIEKENIEAVIISSVVPKIMHSLNNGIVKYICRRPMVIEAGTKTGIKIKRTNPKEVGTDRIVDAVGAYELYGGPCIVIDFGTATTYDLITEDGSFEAGITSPGIRISAEAMWKMTAQLPEIQIKKPETILARDTITSMQAGVFYGYLGQTEYIIDQIKKESGIDNLKVIATGGLGRVIVKNTDRIDIYDTKLTLQGMRLIYEKNDK